MARIPSIWMEPCPTVVMETWANGRAIVACKIGGLAELVTHGETGWLVEPFQPQLLADTLNSAFNSPDECNAMADAGRQLLKTTYTKPLWLDRMAAIYRKMGF